MRIIAGKHRGRRIVAPKGGHTRPTGDRVREALFNLVGPVDDASVLDLFAGSGALGLEALSRGARRCVFAETEAAACRAIRQNLESLGLTGALVLQRDAVAVIREEGSGGRRHDLVLLDPPYRLAERLGRELSEALPAVLAPSALVVSESDRRAPLPLDLPLRDERRYGDTLIRIHDPR